MRKPKIENRYNLTISEIKKFKVIDRSQLDKPLFWRNNVVDAWCISGSSGKAWRGESLNTYWIGIYDNTDKIRISFTSYEGMCGYNFNEFFREEDMEDEYDLEIQEKFLDSINTLIDRGIIGKSE